MCFQLRVDSHGKVHTGTCLSLASFVILFNISAYIAVLFLLLLAILHCIYYLFCVIVWAYRFCFYCFVERFNSWNAFKLCTYKCKEILRV